MKILLAGDIHIGRSSTRMPPGVAPREVRAAAAWQRLVDAAIREQADLLLLSGDIADEENRFWEAIGPLEDGIRRLAAAGIRTLAVAGNHDFDVLARLARQFDDDAAFQLLGKGGRWQRQTIAQEGRPVLHVDGWSFPRRHVLHDPLESYDLPGDPDCPTLGMVHGDIYDRVSQYAPIDLARLQAASHGPWLLGHIHMPRLIADPGRNWVLYPGSLQALDPGEPGLHGCWITELSRQTLSAPRQLPLSSARYESLELSMDGLEAPDALDGRLLEPLRRRLGEAVEQGGGAVRGMSVRMKLSGESRFAGDIGRLAEGIVKDLELPHGGAQLHVDRLEVDVLPPLDLVELSRSHAPPGALARLLLELERPASELPGSEHAPAIAALLESARRRIAASEGRSAFLRLESAPPSDAELRRHVVHEARVLLRHLTREVA